MDSSDCCFVTLEEGASTTGKSLFAASSSSSHSSLSSSNDVKNKNINSSSSDTEDDNIYGRTKEDTTNARIVFREKNIIEEEEPQRPKNSTASGGISTGQWKDGLFSCFRLGFFHPHLWNAWLCPQISLGQILLRTDLTWMAHQFRDPNIHPSTTTSENDNEKKSSRNNCPNHSKSSAHPFRLTIRILVFLVAAGNLYDILNMPYTNTSTYVWWHQLFFLGLTLPMSVWVLLVVVRLRRSIRNRYEIQPNRISVPMPCSSRGSSPLCSLSLGNSEDLFCSLFCGCCVISQVDRQTADYEGTEVDSCFGANELRDSSKNFDANTEAPSTTTQNGNNGSGNTTKLSWWFRRLVRQKSPRSKQESSPMCMPPSSSLSLESGSCAHLRYRLVYPLPSSSSQSIGSRSPTLPGANHKGGLE
jgi:hypothetical protein